MIDPATAKMAAQLTAALAKNRGLRYLVVGLLVLSVLTTGAVVFGPWMLTTQLAASLRAQQQAQTDGGSCDLTTGAVVDTSAGSAAPSLSTEQTANARVIWQVAQDLKLGDHAAVIGIATALQESTLRNLNYGDRDSLGLFQQRPSTGWGSPAQVRNPRLASLAFYGKASHTKNPGLVDVRGWQQMSVANAAQAVQRSAFPSAYAKHEKPATGLVALFRSKAPAGTPEGQAALGSAMCGNADAAQCPSTAMAVEAGLTPDALRVLRCVKNGWPRITSYGGIGDRPSNVDRDHQEGRAVDVMIPGYQTRRWPPARPDGRRMGRGEPGEARRQVRHLERPHLERAARQGGLAGLRLGRPAATPAPTTPLPTVTTSTSPSSGTRQASTARDRPVRSFGLSTTTR